MRDFAGTAAGEVSIDGLIEGEGRVWVVEGRDTIRVGGTIEPGLGGMGQLDFRNLTLEASAVLELEIGGSASQVENDRIVVTDGLSLAGVLSVSFLDGIEDVVDPLQPIVVAEADPSRLLGGSFANGASGDQVLDASGTIPFFVYYGPSSPFNPWEVSITLASATVPEPRTFGLIALALILSPQLRRRVRSARQRHQA